MRECFVCKSADQVHTYCTVDNSQYVKCAECDLILVDSVAPTETLYRSYDGGNWKSLRRKIIAPFRKFSQHGNFDYNIARAAKIFTFASGFYPKTDTAQPNFLDVGCNKGFLLSVAVENGWNVYGVEVVPELMVPFKNKYKSIAHHIYAGRFIDNYQHFEKNRFDIITAIDVIEHFEDPTDDISKIYNVLKPGGSFIIQTPDGDCPQAEELKEKWGALKPFEHLQIFGRVNLERFAKQIGFKEISFHEPFEQADGNFVAVMRK